MKKSGTSKLKLHLETLRNLDGETLVAARGRLLAEADQLLDTATCISFKRCSGCNPCSTSDY